MRLVRLWFLLLVACSDLPRPLTAAERQARVAATGAPAELVLPGPRQREITVFRARAWVDEGYRARTSWRDQLEASFSRLNAYLEPGFGVRIDVELRAWPAGERHDDLDVPLYQLQALDDGAGVDWVMGFVGAADGLAVRHEHLGMAVRLGRHLVVRDMNDAAEKRAIERSFPDLPASRRHHLYVQRKRHKETAVLLHELGHTLGGLHEVGGSHLMSPYYTAAAARFSPANARSLALGLELRGLRGDDPATQTRRAEVVERLRQHVERGDARFDEDDRAELIAYLARGAASPSRWGGWAADPVAEWRRLAGESEARPGDLAVQLQGCELAVAGVPEAMVACRRAVAIAGGGARPCLLEARVHQQRGALEATMASLEEARARLLGGAADASTWALLARAYLRLDSLTRGEEAARLAGPVGRAMLDAARVRRRWLGLPPGLPSPGPRDEWAYAQHIEAIERAFEAEAYVDAAELVDGGLAVYPGTPGLLAEACRVIVYAGDGRRGRVYCDEALAAWDESLVAHLVLANSLSRDESVIRHFERVLALDPDYRAAYVRLASVYEERGRSAERDRLAMRYEERFGQELPAR